MAPLAIDFLADLTNDAILAELRRIASVHDARSVTKSQIDASGRVSYSLINKRFGSLRRALQLAGLQPQRFMKASDQELLEMLVELWERVLEKEGRTPQRKDLASYRFPVSGDTILRRFGSWKRSLIRAYESVTNEASASIEENVEPSAVDKAPERKPISLRKRFFVMKRDEFACSRCGASGHGVRLEIHHQIPFSKGGSDSLDNLRTLCFDCNRGQRNDMIT